ncbi:hypothetical protein [Limosilactobacillus reuteri]|uniref:hypothetical protein n=1 Tax=Limosilactobacillus reuteri TaxID=1598 RepID=UPI00128C6326|nr:hypothetical protein [Limosilactobacillus reuteri]MQB66307.1 hypothetical protein [Limosilactobacillus reuteri]
MKAEMKKVSFEKPIVSESSEQLIVNMTSSLGIPRNFLPTGDQIDWGLRGIYRTLSKTLPKNEVDDLVVKMTIASSVGLFDGAIVYMWNKVIKTLRSRVKAFGSSMIKNVLQNEKNIDKTLDDITDAKLIDLAYQLNIISEDGRMFLQQCREIRNEASIAHPNNMKIDEEEMINFISRCCKYGLANAKSGHGVELKEVIDVLEKENISNKSIQALAEKIKSSFELQQEFFIKILYKKYINPRVNSYIRRNSMALMKNLQSVITSSLESDLITMHREVVVKGDDSNHSQKMSQKFFEELGMLNSLDDYEKISIYNNAIINLNNVHNSYNNFYNEPPFADRLYAISTEINPIPETVISKYVNIILECFLGNIYGFSDNAEYYYERMLKNLSPKGIEALLDYSDKLTQINGSRKSQLTLIINYYYINNDSLTPNQKLKLEKLIKKFKLPINKTKC